MSQAGSLSSQGGVVPPNVPTSFVTDNGTAIPAANTLNVNATVEAAGVIPFQTTGSGNNLGIRTQYSQAIASTNALNVGLSAFDSSAFNVDANGFVSLIGSSSPFSRFIVDTGTSPVTPNGGSITITGDLVAAGSFPIRTDGTAADTVTIEVQTAQAAAATDPNKVGLALFSSASFSVDANGFVTLASAGPANTITGDSGGALPTTGNNWNILGGPGVTTSGSGSTLTINSVVFTDTTAATLAVDNGYFATAAGTYALPATAVQGEMLIVVCDTAGAVVLDAPALNFIRIGSAISGAGGTATSNAIGDSLTLRYRLSTLTWEATSVIGTWTLA